MTVRCLHRSTAAHSGPSSSESSRTATTTVVQQQPKALRRSARLHSTSSPLSKTTEPERKKRRVAARSRPSTSTIVEQPPSPRTLRLQKRNREPEQRILVTPPISALKKRKSRVAVEGDDLVVKKKRKEGSPCIALDVNSETTKKHAKTAPKPRSPAIQASRVATRSTTKLESESLVTLTPLSPPASPPSSPPLNPATYPIPLDIVDIGVSAVSSCTSPSVPETTPNWGVVPNSEATYPELPFDPAVFFTPENSVDHAPVQESQDWSNNGSNNYQYQSQPEIIPQPQRRPRQQPLWVMACKMRVFEVEKYYPRSVIRSIVAQQANDYYSVHGPPPRSWRVWNPHVDEDSELTSEDEFGFRSVAAREKAQETEDDTDDDEEDSDEYEGYGGDVMQLDVPVKEDGFNAELTSSLSYSNGNMAPYSSEWSQPASPLMTAFALPSGQQMLPISEIPPAPFPTSNSMFTETPMRFMPVFPVSLPRLSSVKVMGLRSMFDVMTSPLEDDDESTSHFTNEALLSSAVGIPQTELRPRKRRRDGMGNGTPVDPLRRAIWASAGGGGGVWGLDDFGMDLGLDGFVNNVSSSSSGMQVDLNPLDMEGAVKQFAALQQVYEVLSCSPTGYPT